MDGLQSHIWEVGIGIISSLAMINAYFINRLIKKIDESSTIVSDSSKQIAILTEKVQVLSDMQHRLTSLEKQVAIFEYIIKKGSNDSVG